MVQSCLITRAALTASCTERQSRSIVPRKRRSRSPATGERPEGTGAADGSPDRGRSLGGPDRSGRSSTPGREATRRRLALRRGSNNAGDPFGLSAGGFSRLPPASPSGARWCVFRLHMWFCMNEAYKRPYGLPSASCPVPRH